MNARCHKSVGNPAGLTLRYLVFFLHIIDIIALSRPTAFFRLTLEEGIRGVVSIVPTHAY